MQVDLELKGAQRINVSVQDREVKGFVNTQGELLITWACISEDVSDIPLKDKEYFIQLFVEYMQRQFI